MLWRPAYHRRLAQLADGITIAFAFVLAYLVWLSAKSIVPSFPGRDIEVASDLWWKIVISLSFIWVVVLSRLGAYTYQRFTSLQREMKLVGKASLVGTLILFAMNFLFRFEYVPRGYVAIFFFVSFAILGLEKIVVFRVAQRIREKGKDRKKILLVGSGAKARDFIETVGRNLGWGLDIVGLIAENGSGKEGTAFGKKILGTKSEIETILHQQQVDEVIVCASAYELGQVEEVLETCEREGVQVRLNSDFFGRLAKKVTVDEIYGLPIISFLTTPSDEWALYLKRFLDILVAGIMLVVLSPVFFIIAVLVKATSGGPVLYDWNVMGFNKKPFRSYKFRTMVVNADEMKEGLAHLNEMDGPVFKIQNDPRVTRVGAFLRKFSLDELPQLWSVLKGDMSLVGPRPAFSYELERYESWHRRKLSIKPGITCLWQTRGRNGICDFNEWVKLDLEYIDNWSLWLDVKILLRTFGAVFRGTGS